MRIVNRSRDEGSSVPCVSSLVVVCVGEGNHRVNHSRSNFPYVAIGGYSSYVERFLGFCDGGVQQWYIFDCRKFDVVQPAATAQTITCWSRRRSCSAIMVLDINCAAHDVAIKLLTIIDRGGWWQPAIWLSDIESLPICRYG